MGTLGAEYGFAWRALAGIPSPADHARLGEQPADDDPPDPPGLGSV